MERESSNLRAVQLIVGIKVEESSFRDSLNKPSYPIIRSPAKPKTLHVHLASNFSIFIYTLMQLLIVVCKTTRY